MTAWFCALCRKHRTATTDVACPNCCGFRSPLVREAADGSWVPDRHSKKGAS